MTWNVAQALQLWTDWWSAVVDLAKERGSQAGDFPGLDGCPSVEHWSNGPSPRGCERASRKRMAQSGNAAWRARAANSRAVEGPTEVDVAVEGSGLLVFVEAKLGSDCSMSTTYAPLRNQIAWNIDCVIESADNREALCWMFVKERKLATRHAVEIEACRSDVQRLGSPFSPTTSPLPSP